MILLYTDASLITLSRYGGLGVVAFDESDNELFRAAVAYTGIDGCIVRAELNAMLRGLQMLPPASHAVLHSDSLSGILLLSDLKIIPYDEPVCLMSPRSTKPAKAARKLQEAEARYHEVVSAIAETLTEKSLTVRCVWIKGHSSDRRNALADQLATQGIREAKNWGRKILAAG